MGDSHSGYDFLFLLHHHCKSGSKGSDDDDDAVLSDQVLPSDHHNCLQSVLLLPDTVVQNPKLVLPAVRELLLLWGNDHRLFIHSNAEGGVCTHAPQIPSLSFLCPVPRMVLHDCFESGEETLSCAILHVHLDSCEPADYGDSL